MPYYHCTVADLKGIHRDVVQQAGNEAELLQAFVGGPAFLLSYAEATLRSSRARRLRYSPELVLEFTEIMAALLAAENTVASALELCRSMSGQNHKLKNLCAVLLEGVRKGEGFHQSLSRCASSFPPLYQGLVRVGEKTGTIAEVFQRLAGYLATGKTVKHKIQGALIYPACVLGAAFAGSAAVLVAVVPRMVEIFSVFSTADNTFADSIAGMYRTVYLMIGLLALAVAGVIVLLVIRRSPTAALYFDKLVLRLPFVGSLVTAMDTLDLFFAMELCGKAGMNVADALAESQAVVRNRAYAQSATAVHEAVLRGEKISAAFADNKTFPPVVGTWLAVGEKTGQAALVFGRIRTYFEQAVETRSGRLLGLLEPVLILVAGIIVLLLIVQFVVPLYSLYGAVL